MKTRTTIALIALGLLVSAAPVLERSETKAEDMVNRACSVIMTPASTTEAIVKALTEILDASLLILPKTDYSEEFRRRISVAKKMCVERSMFSDKVHQYLGLAYKLITGGKVWQFPEELTSAYREKDIMGQAKKIGLGRTEGRPQRAIRSLPPRIRPDGHHADEAAGLRTRGFSARSFCGRRPNRRRA